jgi:hypothetical protein
MHLRTLQKCSRLVDIYPPFHNILDDLHRCDEEVFVDIQVNGEGRVQTHISEKDMAPHPRHPVKDQTRKKKGELG